MTFTSLDWVGIIGLALTIGGIFVTAVISFRMKKPEADRTNAETIAMLSDNVNKFFKQIQELQSQQTEDRKLIEELQSAPGQLVELRTTTKLRVFPKPQIESQESTIIKVNGGAIE